MTFHWCKHHFKGNCLQCDLKLPQWHCSLKRMKLLYNSYNFYVTGHGHIWFLYCHFELICPQQEQEPNVLGNIKLLLRCSKKYASVFLSTTCMRNKDSTVLIDVCDPSFFHTSSKSRPPSLRAVSERGKNLKR